jgi:4-amino-4-deoxy-L-arabinose transferase-like glycosyltransferase
METIHILKKNSFLIVLIALLVLLFYTRFVNAGWGLPYPFHPDERNMADALIQLHCTGWNKDCFNPHFFAYGQLPLYLGYAGLWLFHSLAGSMHQIPLFSQAVLSLRAISAGASVAVFIVMLKTAELFVPKLKRKSILLLFFGLIFIFSPALIQFAHFGTTESLLMLFYTILIYLSSLLLFLKIKALKYSILAGIVCGLAIATKVSSVIFFAVPVGMLLHLCFMQKKSPLSQKISSALGYCVVLAFLTALCGFIFSPYNFISLNDFLGSMRYESSVGLGTLPVFYTRQFAMTVPVFFQLRHIFPYALGGAVTFFSLTGLLFLPNKKEYNALRYAFIVYFLPSAYVFTKWTRFMAPIFPMLILVAAIFVYKLIDRYVKRNNRFLVLLSCILLLLFTIPGVRFLAIYRNNDLRFVASDWIYNNIPPGATILSETANVVDLPIVPPYKTDISSFLPSYNVVSFNFYDLDSNPDLLPELRTALSHAQYIIIPSRRIFANHTCLTPDVKPSKTDTKSARCKALEEQYPLLNEYYTNLFSGALGFKQIKKFDLNTNDENAEETWTVFDHPTIRIYKKVFNSTSSI